MKKTCLALLSLFSLHTHAAFPDLPAPTGTCSGLVSFTNNYDDDEGGAMVAFVFDFDELRAYGEITLFKEDLESDENVYANWSLNQDGLPIELSIETDPSFPTAHLVTFQVDVPGDELEYDLRDLPLTGNAHMSDTVTARLLPVNGGTTFLMQLDRYHGVCQAH